MLGEHCMCLSLLEILCSVFKTETNIFIGVIFSNIMFCLLVNCSFWLFWEEKQCFMVFFTNPNRLVTYLSCSLVTNHFILVNLKSGKDFFYAFISFLIYEDGAYNNCWKKEKRKWKEKRMFELIYLQLARRIMVGKFLK